MQNHPSSKPLSFNELKLVSPDCLALAICDFSGAMQGNLPFQGPSRTLRRVERLGKSLIAPGATN